MGRAEYVTAKSNTATVELMDHDKKMRTCGRMKLESLTEETCAKDIDSSAAKRLIFNTTKIIMHNRASKNKIYPRA